MKAIVLGAGGFIGGHLSLKLKELGYWVRGVDIKFHEFFDLHEMLDEFVQADLRDPLQVEKVIDFGADEIYQLAADMGGIGYIDMYSGNDSDILHNSALININVAKEAAAKKVKKLFYSSSACIYPEKNQLDPLNPKCDEASGRSAPPDSCYGWEKLFSEILYEAFAREKPLEVRIARFHNIFGPFGTWQGGREKAPAALCRKVAETKDGESIAIWGTGSQTRSFLYIDECIDGILRLMRSDFQGPVNIGSDELVSINQLADMIIEISGKKITKSYVRGPIGVNGRNSDNRLISHKLGWAPSRPLREGLEILYPWILSEVNKNLQSL